MVSYSLTKLLMMMYVYVLILVVVEDGLVPDLGEALVENTEVLILVVVEDGLVLDLIRHYWLSIS